jgi:hypothetical protein
MSQESNKQLRKTWRNRIDRQRQSGQTIAQFCQQEGVSTPSYYKWKQKLQGKQPARQKRTTPRRKAKVQKQRQVKETAPSVSSPFVQLSMPAPPSCPWIEVVLSEGTIVRLPQQNLAALKAVLGALGNTPPSVIEESQNA